MWLYIKRTRTASQGVLQHITQYACLWLNQQAGKTNLKNTNIGDIKHNFFSLHLFTLEAIYYVLQDLKMKMLFVELNVKLQK